MPVSKDGHFSLFMVENERSCDRISEIVSKGNIEWRSTFSLALSKVSLRSGL